MWLQLSPFLVFIFLCFFKTLNAETEQIFKVSELVPIGYRIGWAYGNEPYQSSNTSIQQPNFLIVFPDPESQAERLLDISEKTGEIVVRDLLDYEKETRLIVLVVPTNGAALSIRIIVEIIDENDNAPKFPLEISEYARINTELALPIAHDADSGRYSTQKYRILSGNVNNIFRIASHFFNQQLYVDLIVNGKLDREYRDRYDLQIEALDEVNIFILDANDNAPEFFQTSYLAHINSNATNGFPVIKLNARDPDEGENSRITFKFNKNLLKKLPFEIDENTGLVSVYTPLAGGESTTEYSVYELLKPHQIYEILVSASDHGQPHSLETKVLLRIQVEEPIAELMNNVALLNVLWLTDDATPQIPENLIIGYVLARISIEGKTDAKILSLTGSKSLCLKQTDSAIVYLLIVCGELDRETNAFYRLNLILRNSKDEIVIEHPLHVDLIDKNDNSPKWNQTQYRIRWNWHRWGQSTTENQALNNIRFLATDLDEKENARIRYSILDTSLFSIEPELGILSIIEEVTNLL